jgi:anti-sigma regulatory factor (Ser/Thr protein kinase)
VIAQAEDVLLARTAAGVLCEQVLGDGRRRELVLHAVGELGRNILQHAGEGTIALASVRGAKTGIEICAHDRGPGVELLAAQLVPRRMWSPAPEPGLRGVKRMAHEFDIHTSLRGTHVRVVFYR